MTYTDTRVWFSKSFSRSTHPPPSLNYLAVTGTSSGLGKSFVEAVLASGERVVATLRKPEVLAYLKDKYTPEQLLIQQLDVANDEQIEAAFAATKKHFGRLDVVVNNAGYGLFGEAEGLPLDEARKQVEVLFWGPVKISLKVRSIDKAIYSAITNVFSRLSSSSEPTVRLTATSTFSTSAPLADTTQSRALPSTALESLVGFFQLVTDRSPPSDPVKLWRGSPSP